MKCNSTLFPILFNASTALLCIHSLLLPYWQNTSLNLCKVFYIERRKHQKIVINSYCWNSEGGIPISREKHLLSRKELRRPWSLQVQCRQSSLHGTVAKSYLTLGYIRLQMRNKIAIPSEREWKIKLVAMSFHFHWSIPLHFSSLVKQTKSL